jgi:hypothetical protein
LLLWYTSPYTFNVDEINKDFGMCITNAFKIQTNFLKKKTTYKNIEINQFDIHYAIVPFFQNHFSANPMADRDRKKRTREGNKLKDRSVYFLLYTIQHDKYSGLEK